MKRYSRIIHRAAKVGPVGEVSSRCNQYRAINMKTSSWTMSDEAVTCNRCKVLIKMDSKGKS